MSVFLLTLPLLWAQVNPPPPGPAAKAPEAAQAKGAVAATPAPAPGPAQGARQSRAAAPNAAAPIAVPPISPEWGNILAWIYLTGDPGVTSSVEPGLTRAYLLGQLLFWLKAVGLLCLVGWVVSWLVIGIKERVVAHNSWFHYRHPGRGDHDAPDGHAPRAGVGGEDPDPSRSGRSA